MREIRNNQIIRTNAYLHPHQLKRVNLDFAETFKAFDNSEMELICPVLPVQHNGFDCGVYLLHYSEKLFER